MKELFGNNSFFSGFIASLAINILTAGVLALALWLLKFDILLNLKIFVFTVVPSIFVLRFYASNQMMKSLKGSVLCLVISLAGILLWLYSMNIFDEAFNWRINL